MQGLVDVAQGKSDVCDAVILFDHYSGQAQDIPESPNAFFGRFNDLLECDEHFSA